jgi:hypothetical protein
MSHLKFEHIKCPIIHSFITFKALVKKIDWQGTLNNILHYLTDFFGADGVVCFQCILQWTYITGNTWGLGPQNPFFNTHDCRTDKEPKTGCGPQETFRNCADICIGEK